MIRTKIVATLGPAASDANTILQMFQAGADVCRLNFSHGALDEHAKLLTSIREAATRLGQPIAVLGDLGGPKIRLGQVADENGTGGMPIDVEQELIIQRKPVVGAAGRVSTTYAQLVDDVKPGDRVLVEDGLLRFVCTQKSADELQCTCKAGGVLKTAKGVNLPDTKVSVPSITPRDWQCADWAIEHDLDYLALSFVRHAEEIVALRRHLEQKKSPIRIIAKIEKPEALQHIDAIIEAADGLMVARGDLGVEMDLATVPITQKELIRRCHAAAKPVIVATQMLQSMIAEPTPTRAEVSDVANAIFEGADAVMLSGETSVGKFPVAAVQTMNHVAEVTESYLARDPVAAQVPLGPNGVHLSSAIAHGVWSIVHDVRDVPVKLVVLLSQTGTTARIFSQRRLPVPVLALSDDERAVRQMVLYYGTLPQKMTVPEEMGALVAKVDEVVLAAQLAAAGERIVIVAGSSEGGAGMANGIVVHTVGQQWATTPAAAGARTAGDVQR
jgi:pyruvate kinase